MQDHNDAGSRGCVLIAGPMSDEVISQISSKFGPAHVAPPPPPAASAILCVATTGKAPVDRALIEALPALRRIACLGAGCEGVDVAAAAGRGVAVTTTSAVLADDVADLALGLSIGLFRGLAAADAFVRSGGWAAGRYPLGRSLRGARAGIVGLGTIGRAVAARATACGMEIAYHSRRARPDVPFRHVATAEDLAGWADLLVICCPGGPETRGLVGEAVIAALGPAGYLVNVARGSVVDEAALVRALDAGRIAGAALDVFADEPHPHPALVASPRTLLTPHIGSATRETRAAMTEALLASIGESVDPCG